MPVSLSPNKTLTMADLHAYLATKNPTDVVGTSGSSVDCLTCKAFKHKYQDVEGVRINTFNQDITFRSALNATQFRVHLPSDVERVSDLFDAMPGLGITRERAEQEISALRQPTPTYTLNKEDILKYLASLTPEQLVGQPVDSANDLTAKAFKYKHPHTDPRTKSDNSGLRIFGISSPELVSFAPEVRAMALAFDGLKSKLSLGYKAGVTKAQVMQHMAELLSPPAAKFNVGDDVMAPTSTYSSRGKSRAKVTKVIVNYSYEVAFEGVAAKNVVGEASLEVAPEQPAKLTPEEAWIEVSLLCGVRSANEWSDPATPEDFRKETRHKCYQILGSAGVNCNLISTKTRVRSLVDRADKQNERLENE